MLVQEFDHVCTIAVVVSCAIQLYIWCRGLFYLVFIALAYQFNPWIVLPLLYFSFFRTVATPGVFWEQFFCGVIIALGYQLYSWWRERHRAEEELCSDYARYQYSQQGLEKMKSVDILQKIATITIIASSSMELNGVRKPK